MSVARVTIEIAPNAEELDEVTRPDLFIKLGAIYELGSGGSRKIAVGEIGKAVETSLAQNIPWYNGSEPARIPQPIETAIRTSVTPEEYKVLEELRRQANAS